MEFIKERVLLGSGEDIRGQLDEYAGAGMDTAFILPVPVEGTDYQGGCREIIETLAPSSG
jgi:alkanesulfonate monooxygenase SsuD/methylene tetrahydromethanopterin reductase-like flavin-dependent oxidoreductase (luciferase family)